MPRAVVTLNDDVIERVSFARALKLYPIDDRTGQPSGFRTSEHRQQVSSAHLSFEQAAGGAARCRTCAPGGNGIVINRHLTIILQLPPAR
jgi:hypothetical protein